MRLRVCILSIALARLCRRPDDRRIGLTIAGGNSALTRSSSRDDSNNSSIVSLVPLDRIAIFGEVRPCFSRATQTVAKRYSAADADRLRRIAAPEITM